MFWRDDDEGVEAEGDALDLEGLLGEGASQRCHACGAAVDSNDGPRSECPECRSSLVSIAGDPTILDARRTQPSATAFADVLDAESVLEVVASDRTDRLFAFVVTGLDGFWVATITAVEYDDERAIPGHDAWGPALVPDAVYDAAEEALGERPVLRESR